MSTYIDFDLKNYELPKPINMVIPKGDYILQVISYEFKDTKKAIQNNTNEFYANIKLRVVNGEYENRILFDILNLKNSNEDAERISRQRLKSIVHYSGLEDSFNETKNMDILIHAIVGAFINIEIHEYKGVEQERNRIVSYKDPSKINIYTKPKEQSNDLSYEIQETPFPDLDDKLPF